MGVEGIGRGSIEGMNDLRGGSTYEAVVCKAGEFLGSVERAIGAPNGAAGGTVDKVIAHIPVTRTIHHGREILESACRDAIEGEIGKRTARIIAGSVGEEITRGLVVAGTVLGVGGALASGGSVIAVGGLGAAAYVLLPSLVRTGAEAVIERLDSAAKRLGVELRKRMGPALKE